MAQLPTSKAVRFSAYAQAVPNSTESDAQLSQSATQPAVTYVQAGGAPYQSQISALYPGGSSTYEFTSNDDYFRKIALWNGAVCGVGGNYFAFADTFVTDRPNQNRIGTPAIQAVDPTYDYTIGANPISINGVQEFIIGITNTDGVIAYISRDGNINYGAYWSGLITVGNAYAATIGGPLQQCLLIAVFGDPDTFTNYFLCQAQAVDGLGKLHCNLVIETCQDNGVSVSIDTVVIPTDLQQYLDYYHPFNAGSAQVSAVGFTLAFPYGSLLTLAPDGGNYAVTEFIPYDAITNDMLDGFYGGGAYFTGGQSYVDATQAFYTGHGPNGAVFATAYGPFPSAWFSAPAFSYNLNCRLCLPVANGTR